MARSRANGTMETALQNGKVLSPLCPASCLKTSRFLSHMEVLLPFAEDDPGNVQQLPTN